MANLRTVQEPEYPVVETTMTKLALANSKTAAPAKPKIEVKADDENLGCWTETVALLRRLNATTSVEAGCLHAKFNDLGYRLESRIYPTRGVAIVGTNLTTRETEVFKLSTAVEEPRAFSVELHSDERRGFVGITFAPLPEDKKGINGVELAKRYVLALGNLNDKYPKHFVVKGTRLEALR